jgi:L-ascorbate metabolism protein UlaG (beta-lactamase superfamily)
MNVASATGFLSYGRPDSHAYAYRFDTPGRSIVLSGDTTYSPELIALARGGRHLSTEPDDADDAQGRRDAAWAQYRDRLQSAWRTNPNAATQIERQGEQWRGGK